MHIHKLSKPPASSRSNQHRGQLVRNGPGMKTTQKPATVSSDRIAIVLTTRHCPHRESSMQSDSIISDIRTNRPPPVGRPLNPSAVDHTRWNRCCCCCCWSSPVLSRRSSDACPYLHDRRLLATHTACSPLRALSVRSTRAWRLPKGIMQPCARWPTLHRQWPIPYQAIPGMKCPPTKTSNDLADISNETENTDYFSGCNLQIYRLIHHARTGRLRGTRHTKARSHGRH